MITIRVLIQRAFRKNNISGIGRALEAAEIQEGLEALNAMVPAWKLRSVDLSWSEVSESDNFPLGDEYIEGFVYLLAEKLSPDYTAPTSFDAEAWFNSIQANNSTTPSLTVPDALLYMPSQLVRRP